MKKIILLITILILLSLFLVSNLTKFDKDSEILGKAVSVLASLSIEIMYTEEYVVNESSNVTFSDPDANRKIKSVTELIPNTKVNFTSYGRTFPQSWDEPEPTENEVKKSFKYFELSVSNNAEGSYKIYFDISQNALGTTHPNDVRLFVYESGWSGLPTAVIHASSPIELYAVTTHFSKFLIGEITTEASSEESSGSGSSGGGGCSHRWECIEWNECTEEGIQTRICEYKGSCGTPNTNPYSTEQECEYTPQKKVPEKEVEEKPKEGIPEPEEELPEEELPEEELPEEELLKEPELEKPSPIARPSQILILIGFIIITLIVLHAISIRKRKIKFKKVLTSVKKYLKKSKSREKRK